MKLYFRWFYSHKRIYIYFVISMHPSRPSYQVNNSRHSLGQDGNTMERKVLDWELGEKTLGREESAREGEMNQPSKAAKEA